MSIKSEIEKADREKKKLRDLREIEAQREAAEYEARERKLKAEFEEEKRRAKANFQRVVMPIFREVAAAKGINIRRNAYSNQVLAIFDDPESDKYSGSTPLKDGFRVRDAEGTLVWDFSHDERSGASSWSEMTIGITADGEIIGDIRNLKEVVDFVNEGGKRGFTSGHYGEGY